jgi:hypothetical protein
MGTTCTGDALQVTRLGIGLLGAAAGALAVWLVIGRPGAGRRTQ